MLAAGLALALASNDLCDAPDRLPRDRISIDLKDAELQETFRLLAEMRHVNVVVPDDVKGSITIALHDAPWGDVVCTIARAKKLTVAQVGDVYLIAPLK